MDSNKCLKSIIIPWHNEFIAIWLYIGFGLYFWVETFLCIAHSSRFKFINQHNYEFMFLALLGISLSLTATAIYIIFYSISESIRDLLDSVDYMGKLTMVFLFTFAFIGSELHDSQYYFPFMFSVGALLILNLVLSQYDFGRIVSFWISFGIIFGIYAYDFLYNSSPKVLLITSTENSSESLSMNCLRLSLLISP